MGWHWGRTAPSMLVLPGIFWQPTIYGLVEVVEEGVVGAHLKMLVQVLLGEPLGMPPLGVVHETLFGPDFG